jgi:hypothetical protein
MSIKTPLLDRHQHRWLIYGHPVIMGGCLVAASLFALIFFFFKVDIADFTRIFFGANYNSSIGEILFQTGAWVGKVACFLGLILGLCLLVTPATIRRIERKLNIYMETRSFVGDSDRSGQDIDAISSAFRPFSRASRRLISCLLIVLSISICCGDGSLSARFSVAFILLSLRRNLCALRRGMGAL